MNFKQIFNTYPAPFTVGIEQKNTFLVTQI